MKLFFLLLIPFFILFLSGCTPKYDYTVHKPKVKYKKPSRDALARTLKEKLGTDYVWAEEGPKAFDCSGLTYYSYGRMNMTIPRVAREQAKVGKKVTLDELVYGDLIFFDTTKRKTGKITHVGIYIGDGRFQHASSSTEGVIITDLNKPYYKKRVVVCKRYLPSDLNTTLPTYDMPTQPFMVTQKASSSRIATVEKSVIHAETISHTPAKGRKNALHHYYIQVGAFSQQPTSGLFQQISSNGFKYKILKISKNGTALNKVVIGPYLSKRSASQSLDTVQQTILPGAFIVSL